jgi:hypothetical protein
MRHQLAEGDEVKNRHKKVADRMETGSEKNAQTSDELTDDEIDPADFFDPEYFGYRRRGFHAPHP